MIQNQTDRRVRKTKALFRQGLTNLMGQKPLKDITVTELTELVDMNRGTFYCHYKDIYDLAEQLEKEMLEEFQRVVDGYTAEGLRDGLHPILRDIFEFIDRNADLCAAFLGPDGGDLFLSRLKKIIYEKVIREWGALYGFSQLGGGDYYLSFLVAGTVGMVQTWGRKERRETPEQMAALAEQLIQNGITPLKI